MSILIDYVLPFLLVLSPLVFVHELGHFLVARWNKVKVEVFSIGFGPELFGWNDSAGTRWKISALPLGGYVKMFGDADASSAAPGEAVQSMSAAEQAVSYHHKRVGQRAAIAAAGPAANFLFAIILLAGLFIAVGQPYTAAVISEVTDDSAAAAAGLKVGDRITAIDGTVIERFEEIQRHVVMRPGEAMQVTLERGGQVMTLPVTPKAVEVSDRMGNVQKIGQLGVRSHERAMRHHDPFSAVGAAVEESWSIVTQTFKALGQIIAGTRTSAELGGPLRIAQMSGEVFKDGVIGVVWFVALLSVNLGLINLFPIPVLDGGHLVFYAAEAVQGRPLSKRVQELGAMVGLAAVVTLMLFATWNDIVHLRVVDFIARLFS